MTAHTTQTRIAAACTAALLAAAAPAAAQTFPARTPDDFGWQREAPSTTFFLWEFFSQPEFTTENPPDQTFPDPIPAERPAPAAGEFTNATIITSTSNLYTQFNPGYFRFDVPTVPAADVTNAPELAPLSLTPADAPPSTRYTAVLVQLRTLGLRLVRDGSITVTAEDLSDRLDNPDTNPPENWPIAGPAPAVDISDLIFDGPDDVPFAGDIVDETFLFELPGVHPQLSLLFNLQQNTSADAVAIDTAVFTVPAEPATCAGDTNNDNAVSAADLLTVLNNFGSDNATTETGDVAPTDSTPIGDRSVNAADLLTVLNNFGTTCL